jgi:hypothetical protein
MLPPLFLAIIQITALNIQNKGDKFVTSIISLLASNNQAPTVNLQIICFAH